MKSKKLVVLENVNPYPFEILHLSPYNISKIPSIGKLGSWAVLEVFRIEALRRCKTVHRLFQKKVPDYKMYEKYGVFWSHLLEGKLMDLTVPRSNIFDGKMGGGIMNLTWRLNDAEQDEYSDIMKTVIKPGPFQLFIEIDLTEPPHTIIHSLKPYLQLKHKTAFRETKFNLKDKNKSHPFWWYHPPYHSKKEAPIRDVKAWLTYLKCYDYHRCSKASPGQISRLLYGTSKKEDNVDKAIKRTTRLIACAEKNDWPPTKLT